MSKHGGKRHGDAAVAKCLAVYAARTFEFYDSVAPGVDFPAAGP